MGDGACLVVDTRSHLGEAADLIAAVRAVTPHPWTVVNTHAHYDHCFGNAAFRPAPVWGSRGCAAALCATGERQRAAVVARAAAAGRPRAADLMRAAPLDPPDHLVDDVAGARRRRPRGGAALPRPRAHRPRPRDRGRDAGDATVVFAGDLVEEGAPPAFEDAYPADWPATLGRLHALARGPVVPGHGAVVDAAFVGAQREELLAVARRAAGRAAGGRPLRRGDHADRRRPRPR